MKKILRKKRCICYLCGSKKYLENLDVEHFITGDAYFCKNGDFCVIKSSYNRRKKLKNKNKSKK